MNSRNIEDYGDVSNNNEDFDYLNSGFGFLELVEFDKKHQLAKDEEDKQYSVKSTLEISIKLNLKIKISNKNYAGKKYFSGDILEGYIKETIGYIRDLLNLEANSYFITDRKNKGENQAISDEIKIVFCQVEPLKIPNEPEIVEKIKEIDKMTDAELSVHIDQNLKKRKRKEKEKKNNKH